MELEGLEQKYFEQGRVPLLSNIKQVIWQAVIDSARWKKWLLEEEEDDDFSRLSPERQLWLVKTGARYIWAAPQVVAARQKLYAKSSGYWH